MGRAAIVASVFIVACVASQSQDPEVVSSAESESGSGSGSGSCATPLAVVLAPTPLATELRTTNRITVIVSTTSFPTAPTVTLSAFDATTSAPVTDWTISPAQTIAMPATGTAALTFDVTIPSDARTLAARIRARATSGSTVGEAWGSITAAKQVTFEWPAGLATGSHDNLAPQSLTVRVGTTLAWHNADTVDHVLHGQNGIAHEVTYGGQPGAIYTTQVTAPASNAQWYCHSHASLHSLPYQVTIVP